MKKVLFALLLSIFALPSFAKGFGKFGLEDNMHRIQSVDYKGPSGEEFDLSYHTQTRYVIAGVYVSKKGYVLTVRGTDKYLPLDDAMITEMQQDGLLPKPLPEYQLKPMDYVFGYSLWIVLAVVLLWSLISAKFKKRDE